MHTIRSLPYDPLDRDPPSWTKTPTLYRDPLDRDPPCHFYSSDYDRKLCPEVEYGAPQTQKMMGYFA